MSAYYVGQSGDDALGDSPRFLYMVKRNDDGEIFLVRSDQLKDKDSFDINEPGEPSENFEDFEPGIDYFEGIDQNHEKTYRNMVWTQYRWDNRSCLYYINEQGQLVLRINQTYTYPTGHSS